jgi:chemosensory pili system protein ChpE/L-lysine exporter family protein LysE/ArgO
VGVAGVVYLLWLAIDAWRAASQEFAVDESATVRHQRALRAGVTLSVTNPQNIAYWAAMGSAMGAVGVHHPTSTDYGVFFTAFMVSSVVWAFFCAAVVDRLFKRAGARWARATYKLCALAFLALALGSVRDLVVDASKPPLRDGPAIVGRP